MLLPAVSSVTHSLNSLKLSSSSSPFFLNGATQIISLKPHHPTKPTIPKPLPFFLPVIRAKKEVTGKVVCSTNDKTVSVVVTRLAKHPKYHRRVRIKKKFQAHDPDNQFQVGDMVLLEKCKPISKTKSLLALPVPIRVRNEKKNGAKEGAGDELGIPFESQVEGSA